LEEDILYSAFKTKEVKFPSLRNHLLPQVSNIPEVVCTNIKEWKENLI